MTGNVWVDGVEYPSIMYMSNAPDEIPEFLVWKGVTHRVINGRQYTADAEGRMVETRSEVRSLP